MALLVSGLMVTHSGPMRGTHGGVLPMMEHPQPNLMEEKKKLKTELKRDKNRESSAKSRKRKKEEDEHNQEEIIRLERANGELRRREERILREGQELLRQVDPSFYTCPRCPGCPSVESEPCDGTPPPHLLAPPPPADFMEES